jgi:predicted nucleotidyltransferase
MAAELRFGLPESTIEQLQKVFFSHPEVDRVILYGSRAKGTERPGSDIDLTMQGKGLNLQLMNKISIEIDDLLLPYVVDLSIYHQIDNQHLLEHIERVGTVFYSVDKVSDG